MCLHYSENRAECLMEMEKDLRVQETHASNKHWGQGYPETSENILGTLQALGQFSSIVIDRHI